MSAFCVYCGAKIAAGRDTCPSHRDLRGADPVYLAGRRTTSPGAPPEPDPSERKRQRG